MIVEHHKQAAVKWMCGTPQELCTGTKDPRFGVPVHRLHSSPREAGLCFAKYMRGQGYTKVGTTWRKPSEAIRMA